MDPAEAFAELIELADQEREAVGYWSVETANDRCMRYAQAVYFLTGKGEL